MLDIYDTGRRCVICQIRTSGVPLCKAHYKEWISSEKEPWFKALKSATQKEERGAAQAQARIISLDELEERILHFEERNSK